MRATLGPDRMIRCGALAFPAIVGANGVRADKSEGDMATPAGLLPLRRVLFRADRVAPPRCAAPVEAIAPDDGWCDATRDPAYNRPVTLPYAGRHERLWRDDMIYDIIGVLGWNDAPPVPDRGSAIFLHLTRADRSPTEGCIALDRPHLLALLAAGLSEIDVIPG